MCGREWTSDELQFLRSNYPEHTAYWCAKQLGRSRSSVALKVKKLWLKVVDQRTPIVKREDPDLGPVDPPLANRCVDCGKVSSTRRCPVCQARYLERYNGACWGPTYDEAYGVARSL